MEKINELKNSVRVGKISILQNNIEINYKAEGTIRKYFYHPMIFRMEYSINVEKVPLSIAVIPFITNVLPIIWLTDSTLEIEELDKDFYECIESLKKGYSDMYPMFLFKGKILVKEIIKNASHHLNKTATFFSGGVDAFSTLISHIKEKPDLFTLWGADVLYANKQGWHNVENHIKSTAQNLSLNFIYARTNFRCFLKEESLNKLIKRSGDSWWHGFQHGIGLIGHAAPLAYINRISHIYIASTYTIKDKGKITCASDPTIDNYVAFDNCKVTHDQYEFSRQDKLTNICDFVKNNRHKIELRVCYQSHNGYNCCKCEKCYRTIFGLIAEMCNPADFGFKYTENEFKEIVKNIRERLVISKFCIPLWQDIQSRFIQNAEFWHNNKDIQWILSTDFNKINSLPRKRIKLMVHKTKIAIKYFIHWENIRSFIKKSGS